MSIKVLLADDHTLVLEGMHQLLGKVKDIRVLNSVSDPLLLDSEVSKQSPDILILDVRFRTINGIEYTKNILKTKPELKVIIMSGFNYQEYVQAAFNAGAYSFLSKEKTNFELTNIIRNVAQGKKHFPNIQDLYPSENLTNKEKVILALIAKDYSNEQISKALCISKRTVEYHISSIINKLNVNSRVGAVVKGIKHGYLNF